MSHFETSLDRYGWRNEHEVHLDGGRLTQAREEKLAKFDKVLGIIDRGLTSDSDDEQPSQATVRKTGRMVTLPAIDAEVFAQNS